MRNIEYITKGGSYNFRRIATSKLVKWEIEINGIWSIVTSYLMYNQLEDQFSNKCLSDLI